MESGLQRRKILPAILLSVLVTMLLSLSVIRVLPLSSGIAHGVVSALIAYVLFRILYPLFVRAGGSQVQTVKWHIQDEVLSLGKATIPLSNIRQVYCWPNRDALGHTQSGVVVNIELTGRNQVLRSLTDGSNADESVRRLHVLVDALGYGQRWQISD